MASSTVSETSSPAAVISAPETTTTSADNEASGQQSTQQPLKKTPSRPTAVSSVYELLTRAQPHHHHHHRHHPKSTNVMSSSMISTKTVINSPNGHTTSTLTAIKSFNASPLTTTTTTTATPTSSSSLMMEQATTTTDFNNHNSSSFNNSSSSYRNSEMYRQKQMLIIQNGHHYIHHHNSSPASTTAIINQTTTVVNGAGSTSSQSAYSPVLSSASSSSSSQHSPPPPPDANIMTMTATHRPAISATRHMSLSYTSSNRDDGDDEDDDDYRPRLSAGPMSSLLVIREGDRPFDFYRSKFNKAEEINNKKKSNFLDNEDELYPDDFILSTTRVRSHASSWVASIPSSSQHQTASSAGASSPAISKTNTPVSSPMRGPATAARSPSSSGASSSAETPAVQAQRSASSIKDALLKWCQQATAGYDNVNVTNFSSSWSDGMAFCAIVHHYYPNAFDFSKLDPKRRKANFKLAFDLAEKLGDVPQLLEVEDMVRMKQPDWKCVFTYVQTMYRKLHDKQPTMLPPRKSSGDATQQTASESSTSGIESVSSSGGSPSKLSPMPASLHDDDSPSNPFKAEFERMTLK